MARDAEVLSCHDCGVDVARKDALVMCGSKEMAFCKPCVRKTELGRKLLQAAK